MNTTAYEHIVLNEKDVAVIDGTQTKVVEIVQDVLAHGWSPAEIHFQHPHLSLGQIHSALAYYYDHSSEFEKEIKDRLEKVNQIRQQIGQSALAEKLQAGVSGCVDVLKENSMLVSKGDRQYSVGLSE